MSKKILVVEDDKDIAKNIKDLLEIEGYEVEVACDGQQALDTLSKSQALPSLILLDLMMPKMDGFQFRQEQEKNLKYANIPVVIMTADGHIEAKKERVGAKAYIRKPVDVDTVIKIVERYSI